MPALMIDAEDRMRIFALLYNGFIWGLLVAIIAFQNEWLEMRISVGLIIPAIMLLVVAIALITKKRFEMPAGFTTVNLLVSLLAAFLILGSKRLGVVPAAMIREAVHRPDIGFPSINLFLMLGLITGLTVIWLRKPRN